eukprot:1902257-Rhodomonas_salina.3
MHTKPARNGRVVLQRLLKPDQAHSPFRAEVHGHKVVQQQRALCGITAGHVSPKDCLGRSQR